MGSCSNIKAITQFLAATKSTLREKRANSRTGSGSSVGRGPGPLEKAVHVELARGRAGAAPAGRRRRGRQARLSPTAGRIKTTGADMRQSQCALRTAITQWPVALAVLYMSAPREGRRASRSVSRRYCPTSNRPARSHSIERPLPAELGRLFQISISVSEPLEPPARGSPPGGACWPQSWSSESELAPLLHGLLSS